MRSAESKLNLPEVDIRSFARFAWPSLFFALPDPTEEDLAPVSSQFSCKKTKQKFSVTLYPKIVGDQVRVERIEMGMA